ncbi:MAG TPA: hypothetical protein VJB68_03970, partial [Methylophilaceae bacterium]|nr:hypothetical protein [Methylophilaceae bacterium]
RDEAEIRVRAQSLRQHPPTKSPGICRGFFMRRVRHPVKLPSNALPEITDNLVELPALQSWANLLATMADR